jgi:selenocysteine-specific elongation factor
MVTLVDRVDQAVVATAGHMEHGKSTLVRALTGMDPHHSDDERRRSQAGDLGFAWLTLPSGQRLTFVDVPGQERSVPNLLAGAGPAAAVLFAVAADAGWSSQSARQLAMLDALGIRRGLLVVTRADLADPGPALSQASGQIAASSLGDVEALAVSAVTGQGMPELVSALSRLASSLPVPDPGAPVRVWVDRSFCAAGGATAITGTLAAGTVRTGDELVIAPAMRPVRVRAIRCMGEPMTELTGPARATFQLDGASAEQLGRGSAMVQPGRWVLADVIDVRLPWSGRTGPASPVPATPVPATPAPATPVSATPAPGTAVTATPIPVAPVPATPKPAILVPSRPAAGAGGASRLPRAMSVHVGTAHTVARVRQLTSRVVRLVLREPIPLHVGDRVLLHDAGSPAGSMRAARMPGPGAGGRSSVMGAVVLDLIPPSLTRRGAGLSAGKELAGWPDMPSAADVLRRHGLLRASTLLAMGISDHPEPVCGEWLADPGHWADLSSRLSGAVAAQAGRDTLAPGLSLEAARGALGVPDARLVEALVRPPLRVRDGLVQLTGLSGEAATAGLPARVSAAVQVLLADLAAAPFAAPDAIRLRQLGLDVRAIAAAEHAGLLLRVSDQIVLAPGADVEARAVLAGLPQPFTAAEARQALQTTRRVAIPLLEFLDRAGVTQRLPDDRRTLPNAVSQQAG